MLQAHNSARVNHDAADLVADPNLVESAQNWADHLAQVDSMYHEEDGVNGENIAYQSGKEVLFKSFVP